MDIWRVIFKFADEDDTKWRPFNNKLYAKRNFATSALKSGRYVSYDYEADMWVQDSFLNQYNVYRIVKATVSDEEWVNVPPKK